MHIIAQCFATIKRANYLTILTFFGICWVIFHLSYRPISMLPDYRHQPALSLIKPLPDFSSHGSVSEKKQAFFRYLLPVIASENAHIKNLRTTVKSLRRKLNEEKAKPLDPYELNWIKGLALQYQVNSSEDIDRMLDDLLMRIDTVPNSLVLAQAAIESGWGTSRFAKQGNNLFGHWCFKKGCGLIPNKRANNHHHEVAKFPNINSSVRAYLKNLNSFSAYQEFRELRQSISPSQNTKTKSLTLLAGLSKYSEQGQTYLDKVRRLILANSLTKFD